MCTGACNFLGEEEFVNWTVFCVLLEKNKMYSKLIMNCIKKTKFSCENDHICLS